MITLKKGAALDFEQVDFQTANVNTATNASVEFLVIPAGAVTLTVEINGPTIVTENFTSTVGRVWRENFSASILKKDNTLTVAKNGDATSRRPCSSCRMHSSTQPSPVPPQSCGIASPVQPSSADIRRHSPSS